MSDFDLTYRSPGSLKQRSREYRTHTDGQICRLAESIKTYGFNQPVAIDSDDRIVCGAGLVRAAIQLGLNRIPVIRLDHLDEGMLRAYAIAANKLADLAGYDEAELSLELADIQALLGTYQLPELGIDTAELDRLLGLNNLAPDDAEPEAPDPSRAISRLGDLWQLGRHRLLNADALLAESYHQLMGEDRAQFVISDVPYNLSADTISTTGRHSDFLQAAGELTSPEFTRFMTTAMRHMKAMSTNGSIHMIFMSWHFLLELLRCGSACKRDPVMGVIGV